MTTPVLEHTESSHISQADFRMLLRDKVCWAVRSCEHYRHLVDVRRPDDLPMSSSIRFEHVSAKGHLDCRFVTSRSLSLLR